MSTNGNIIKHYIKLLIRGIREPSIYEVGIEQVKRWQQRLERISEKESQEPIPWLFCFDTANGLTIGVRVEEVQLAHFLFERASDQHITQGLGAADPERGDIHLYFCKRA